MNYVYILRCNDDSLYTGWTNNLEKRIKAHSDGKGAKYTRARVPVELVYFEVFEDKILTCSATTEKPFPASPALAASIEAFKARRLLWLATF